MWSIYNKMKRIIILAAALLLLTGCVDAQGPGSRISDISRPEPGVQIQIDDITDKAGDNNVEPDKEQVPEVEEVPEKAIINEAAWCVYWDPNSASAAVDNYLQYKELVLFGCIYSEDNKLFIPEQLDELIAKLPNEVYSSDDTELYISFINDVIHPDGSSTQKSADFLTNVLTDVELSDGIIEDMIKQTKSYGFDGIELDYENVHKCDSLWDEYLDFISRLYKRAVDENLKLRVILSVSTPVDEMDFIKGPSYIVMCYNLYGNHSGPGPKADEEFLKNTYSKFNSIEAGYALANGGFEWGPDEKTIRSLTCADAADLARESGADEIREDSGALRYSYQSDDGIHTVIYGDEDTIKGWSGVLLKNADENIKINLWRLE